MKVCVRFAVRSMVLVLSLYTAFGAMRVQAQQQHVVSTDELSQDAARPAQTRQTNEAALRQLFSSAQAQNALKSASIDYARVDQAIGQVSDEDLAKLAERSRQVQNDFAGGRAGSLSDRDLLIIIVIALIIILIVAVAR